MDLMDTVFTIADYELLPEGYPAQLIEGCLIREPAPTYGHGRIASEIHAQLVRLLDPSLVLSSPADVAIDEHNVFQPDVLVLRERPPEEAQYVGVPLLAMEILSPSTARRDRTVKKTRLLGLGVAEVWIIDPVSRTVEVHEPQGVRVHRREEEARSRTIEGFSLVPAALFVPPQS